MCSWPLSIILVTFMTLMFTSKVSFVTKLSARRFCWTWRNFACADKTSLSAQNQFFNWWRRFPQICFTSNHAPFLKSWCVFFYFANLVVLLSSCFLEMVTFNFICCCLPTMCIIVWDLAFYVSYKCGICMLLDKISKSLNPVVKNLFISTYLNP